MIASDFYSYYRPSLCGLRVFLREKSEPEAPPGPYESVIRVLARRHELSHLATFPTFVDLSRGANEEREIRTREEVKNRAPMIYQALLQTTAMLGGAEVEVRGDPDFLILDAGPYIVRDSKMARRITEKDHPEIFRQVQLYGWLYEQMFHEPAGRLEVHRGSGDIVVIPYDGGKAALALLESILGLKQRKDEPESPVGWTKCNGCGYFSRCWGRAEQNQDVALVFGVDQATALALYARGVRTVGDLLDRFDEESLAALERPWGKGVQRVGGRAPKILRMAKAFATGEEAVLQRPEIPESPNYVMFDLEGLPPQLDDLEKVYLWGLQVYGARHGEYRPALARIGPDGDREGWRGFLREAATIFETYGDLPFVHWHHYERARLDMYVERYGDEGGIAARVRRNLADLLPITQAAVALPVVSYSLKVIEQYIGFQRSRDDVGGDWAIAKYIGGHRDRRRGTAGSFDRRDLDVQSRGLGGDMGCAAMA